MGVFFIFFFLSVTLLVLAKSQRAGGVQTFLEKIFQPFQSSVLNLTRAVTSLTKDSNSDLREENLKLRQQLVDQKALIEDNKALRDQFQTSIPRSQSVLPAKIVGAPSLVPGISEPETFVIDKGANDGITVGQAVVFKNYLVGKITKVTALYSLVILSINPDFSITAKDVETQAPGVVKGRGSGTMIFDNVILSDRLTLSDLVVSKGEMDINGGGIPKDIIVGKITSIDKKPSALFQTASVKSLLDFSRMETVFVYLR